MNKVSINNIDSIALSLFGSAVNNSFGDYDLVKQKILSFDSMNAGVSNIFQQELSNHLNKLQCMYFLKKGVFIEFDNFVLMQKSVWVDIFKKQLLKDIKKQVSTEQFTRDISANFLISKIKSLSEILKYTGDKNLDRYTLFWILDQKSTFNNILNTAKFIFLTAVAICDKKDDDNAKSLLYEDIIKTYYSYEYEKNYEFFSSYMSRRKNEQEYKAQLQEKINFFQANENEEKMIYYLLTVDNSLIEKGLLNGFTSNDMLPLKNGLQAIYEKIALNVSVGSVAGKNEKLKIKI